MVHPARSRVDCDHDYATNHCTLTSIKNRTLLTMFLSFLSFSQYGTNLCAAEPTPGRRTHFMKGDREW